MRIEQQREKERAKRRGNWVRTIFMSIVLVIAIAVGYYISGLLFAEGLLNYSLFYDDIGIPRVVPEWVFRLVVTFIIVVFLQFFFVFSFLIFSPKGRRRSGMARAEAQDPDPFDRQW